MFSSFITDECESQIEKCLSHDPELAVWQEKLETINLIRAHVISLEQEHKQYRKTSHRLTRHGSK